MEGVMKKYSLLDCRDTVLLCLKGSHRLKTESREYLVNMTGFPDRTIREVIEITPEIGNLGQGYFLLKTKADFLDYYNKLKSYTIATRKHMKRVKNRMLDKAHKVA